MNCLVIDVDEKNRKFIEECFVGSNAQLHFKAAGEALESLPHARYEGILVCANDLTEEVIRAIRATPSNHSVVIIALAEDEYAGGIAARAGATMVVVSARRTRDALARAFRASYSMMLRERLRSCRVPVKAIMLIRAADRPSESVTMVNVSATGVCFQSREQLRQGLIFNFVFALEPKIQIEGEAVVVWSKLGGLSGARFVTIPNRSSGALRDWLEARLEAEDVNRLINQLVGGALTIGSSRLGSRPPDHQR